MAEDAQDEFNVVLNRILQESPPEISARPSPPEQQEIGLASLMSGAKEKAGDLWEWYKRFSYPPLPDAESEGELPVDIIPPAEKPNVEQRWRGNPTIKSIIENDPIIERIIMAESSGDIKAESGDGARGLMQIMPSTSENEAGFGVNYTLDRDELWNPVKNVQFGSDYFKGLRNNFGNDYHALVAYHDGPTNARKWIKKGAKWEDLGPRAKIYIENILGEQRYKGGMIQNNPYPYSPRPI
tara:strand:- start:2881 stop:3600 length:720 start_codon:yes stop_codon:yes gene_type:complete